MPLVGPTHIRTHPENISDTARRNGLYQCKMVVIQLLERETSVRTTNLLPGIDPEPTRVFGSDSDTVCSGNP